MEEGCTPNARVALLLTIPLCLAVGNVCARTWNIAPDGSGDVPTIQAGLDSSSAGDTVIVQSGTYYESALHNLKSGVILTSATGESDCVVIDAQQEWSVMVCQLCDNTAVIQGFTITGGLTAEEEGPPGFGGGMKCQWSSVRVVNCLFLNNVSWGFGGAVSVEAGTPAFENCTFLENSGDQGSAIFVLSGAGCTITDCAFVGNYSGSRGTVYCNGSSPHIQGCTFYGNIADDRGSGISACDFATPEIDNTIIAFGISGSAVDSDEWSHPIFTCCDIYGSVDGDWTGYVAGQDGVNGNFSADPQFCDTAGVDLTLEECSPCLPGHHPDAYDCGGLIGAFGTGCECRAGAEFATWGSIKALYR